MENLNSAPKQSAPKPSAAATGSDAPDWTDKTIILIGCFGILCLLLSFDWRLAAAWLGSEMLKDFRSQMRERKQPNDKVQRPGGMGH